MGDLTQFERLRDIDAGQRSGQPVDQAGLEMGAEIAGEVAEAELCGAAQIMHEGQRVGEDGAQGRTRLLDVDQRAGADDVEDDLQQVPDGLTGPGDEVADEVAEQADDAAECAGQVEQIRDLERMQGVEEELRDALDEADQLGQRALEPGPEPLAGMGALGVGPDLLLVDQLHEAADQRVGGARHGLAGDRVVAEDGDRQVPALGPCREPGDGFEHGVADQIEHRAADGSDEADDAVDRVGEDPLGPLPHVAGREHVADAERMDEFGHGVDDRSGGDAEIVDLRVDPCAGLVEHAVAVERLDDEVAAGQEVDDGAQHVGGGAGDRRLVDRVHAEHDGEHAVAGDQVGLVGQVVQNVV